MRCVTELSEATITTKNKIIIAVIRSANEIQKGFSPSSRARAGAADLPNMLYPLSGAERAP